MDAAAQDLQADSRTTLTLCEAQLAGACSGTDPEVCLAPTCCAHHLPACWQPSNAVPARQLVQALVCCVVLALWPSGSAPLSPHALQDPTCAKISISGRLTPVKKGQLAEAEDLLFTRHPAMRDWPADHGFRV